MAATAVARVSALLRRLHAAVTRDGASMADPVTDDVTGRSPDPPVTTHNELLAALERREDPESEIRAQALDRRAPADARVTSVPQVTLWVGIGVLLIAEAIDGIRTLRRRAAHRLADWWAEIEREDQRAVRRAEIAALAVQIHRRASARHPAGEQLRPRRRAARRDALLRRHG